MLTNSMFRGTGARPAQDPADGPRRSGTPVEVELRARRLDKPVTLAKALKAYGLSLTEAHRAVTTLTNEGRIRLTLYLTPDSGPAERLAAFGVEIDA